MFILINYIIAIVIIINEAIYFTICYKMTQRNNSFNNSTKLNGKTF